MSEITGKSESIDWQSLPHGDELFRFSFEDGRVRGVSLRLEPTWQAAIENHDYPPAVASLLGQAVAGAVLMVASLKFEGRLVLQFAGRGPISLLVVQVTSDRRFRCMAKWDDERLEGASEHLEDQLGRGQLVLTIEPEDGARYQSLVPIAGAGLENAIEGYFQQSEQLPTRLVLAADGEVTAGMLVQQMPETGGIVPASGAAARGFEHVGKLVDTLVGDKGRSEMLAISAPELLHRLFHQEALRIHDVARVSFNCGCTREGVGQMLASLGRGELEATLDSDETPGLVEIRCDFCGSLYRFDRVDVEQLLTSDSVEPPESTRH
ncbi:redox-regulated molecular chaperone Hsp33 [Guyparkeria sp. SCN-R1]|uniref:Hsp33 family molecular chaperone HslO n=1 Tax=Guyparkeria sp. SCN-R1 TaxID=2341113 RepID=UPI000F64E2E2|nr:Hsp33 family molecular chaperone HslO [Guyparkeria sp. SCN-R1]RRQ23665.1 redox-regulated molecular chaperone Hsp33 [Guyparkeria sp. SCN-R1]